MQHFACANLRNLASYSMDLAPGLNIIHGVNGAGKTTILEGIYYLFHGKSFRTSVKPSLINFAQNAFSLHARLHLLGQDEIALGISKSRASKQVIKLNYEKIGRIAKITALLPVKFISSVPQSLLTTGPKARRAYMDWGLFHVKHDFHNLWRDYSKAVASRNSLLKLRLFNEELEYWDAMVAQLGIRLHEYRLAHVFEIIELFSSSAFVLPGMETAIELRYSSGWDDNLSLEEALAAARGKDMAIGHTSVGPHRADLGLYYRDMPVEEVLSAGQLKLLAYRLHLLQGLCLRQALNRDTLFLIDDLTAELDVHNVAAVLEGLASLEAQQIITTLEPIQPQNTQNSVLFHVEQCLEPQL